MRRCKETWCVYNLSNNAKTARFGQACMEKICKIRNLALAPNVINVLDQPIRHATLYVQMLTDSELAFCINAEKRKTMKKYLESEQNKRAAP